MNPKSGTITLANTEFGDQGMICELSIGDGLKSFEGTIEFALYLSDDPSKRNLRITKGKFSLKTGEW